MQISDSAIDSGIELTLERIEEGPFIVQGVSPQFVAHLPLVGNAMLYAQRAKRVTANLRRGSISIHDDGAGFFPYGGQSALIEPLQTGSAASGGVGPVDRPREYEPPMVETWSSAPAPDRTRRCVFASRGYSSWRQGVVPALARHAEQNHELICN